MNALSLNKQKQAILTVLMLRNPQTLNDLKTRTQRMVDFEDVNEIHQVLEKMMQGDEPLVVCIPKAPGRREDRFSHLLCGPIDLSPVQSGSIEASPGNENIGKKVNITKQLKLEERIEVLEQKVEKLMKYISDKEE